MSGHADDERIHQLENTVAVLCAQLDAERAFVRQLLSVIRLGQFSPRVLVLPDPDRHPVAQIPAQRRPTEDSRAPRRR